MDPLVIWTEKKYGKILQLYLKDKPYLIIDDGETMHLEMLEGVLSDNKIPFENVRLGVDLGPAAVGKDYRLAGAGWADLTYSDKIVLYGESDSYRIVPDEEHAKDISRLIPKRVEIEKPEPSTPEKPSVPEKIDTPSPKLNDIIPF